MREGLPSPSFRKTGERSAGASVAPARHVVAGSRTTSSVFENVKVHLLWSDYVRKVSEGWQPPTVRLKSKSGASKKPCKRA
jgi:hypothetical protein